MSSTPGSIAPGPVTVITGGALGIGGATSRRLARRGDAIVLNEPLGSSSR